MKNYAPIFGILLVLALSSCQSQNSEPQSKTALKSNFQIESLRPIIIAHGKKWGQALKNKDAAAISAIYDADAHYLPDAEHAYHGNKRITEYWLASFGFINDIQLEMESLQGNKELLCETGKGIALLPNAEGKQDTLAYKYVNIWKLQKDGTYKVLIDTYNDVKEN